tara:strand:- start:9354 stop:9920 length:567 start_codon:yes stop_codon:yes gene_type:complete
MKNDDENISFEIKEQPSHVPEEKFGLNSTVPISISLDNNDNSVFLDTPSSYANLRNTIQELADKFYSSTNKDSDDSSVKGDEYKLQEENDDEEYTEHYLDQFEEYSRCTIKQLMRICEYYNIKKDFSGKAKKSDVVEHIIWFESQPENIELVFERVDLWKCMNNVASNKFTNRFIVNWKYNGKQFDNE